MLRVAFADDASHAVALHDFAVLADRLHACAYFHGLLQPTGAKNSQTDTKHN